jgi:glyoxylase-like metal-dependent hydrolase (beta-lactamase superfamily II)
MWSGVFDDNAYGTNCWMAATEDGEEAVVVDPGFAPARIHALLEAAGRRAVAVLLTHAHIDHAGEAGAFAGDNPVYIHPADAIAFSDPAAWNPGFPNPLVEAKDLRLVDDGDVLELAGMRFEVQHRPGHTPGHCCFRTDARLFSGDLVFAGSIGRSDFPNSSPAQMRRSLERFLELTDRPGIVPAPYLARAKWVQVRGLRVLHEKEFKELIARSHELVAAKLTRAVRESIGLS